MSDTELLEGWVEFGGQARVRFADIGGDLQPVAVVNMEGLTPEALHAIPIARLRTWANGPQSDKIRVILKMGSHVVLPAGGTWGHAGRRPNPKVTIPEGRRRPDSFYRKVAQVAEGLKAHGSRNPAVEIAEASGVPVTTVHRWLKEARQREARAALLDSPTLGEYVGRRLTKGDQQ